MLEEFTTVCDVHADPRILVRVVGMVVDADLVELGIDLDGVDVLGSVRQRNRNVVAIARTDHEDVGEVVEVAGILVRPLSIAVELSGIVEDVRSALVRYPVHGDGEVGR